MGINKQSLRNGLTIALAVIFLASNLGIAKVSHYCSMALASAESDCCSAKTQEPACCNTETEENDGCCTNLVQVFQADYQSPIPSFYNLKIKAADSETIYGTAIMGAYCFLSHVETHDWHFESVRPPGPSVHLLYSVFLI
ncbi:MAG: HYC_CC_PP family protein [Bacteroidota bacterium]